MGKNSKSFIATTNGRKATKAVFRTPITTGDVIITTAGAAAGGAVAHYATEGGIGSGLGLGLVAGGAVVGLGLGRLTGLTGYQPLEDIGRQLLATDAASRAEATVDDVLKQLGASKEQSEAVKASVSEAFKNIEGTQQSQAPTQQQPSA